ncbi:hypothetical protein L6164_020730 [Bauhinia variegata]|uniref:Uncharacterized protein n=1 Tax=Bauhinia variegata TaxID=167791 RepID=A0ACB9MWC7_BAUVA|nr:hypothetical protein L6164_020730 [Bauhinia variegata]
MEVEMERETKNRNSFWSFCSADRHSREEDGSTLARRERPGWKAMPYILGNEFAERISSFGLQANFIQYLVNVFKLSNVAASNVINIWMGVGNMVPIIGAYFADATLGKFRTIALSSFGTLLGLVIITLTAWVPHFHPPSCNSQHQDCAGPTSMQLAILSFGLCWMVIGAGGIRPCSIPFSIDQFDNTNAEGRKGISSFYNWYYTTQTIVQMINATLIVYIQGKSWVIGFGVLAVVMLLSIFLFFAGSKVYICIPAEGSILSGISKVFGAAYKKRHLQLPSKEDEGRAYYDPPLEGNKQVKMPLTEQLKCLNKAALIRDKELSADGLAVDTRRLCSIQQVENVKCLIKLIPIWLSGIICMIPIAQQSIYPVLQAARMDRHFGKKFEIPAASMSVVSLITIGIFLPCYDRFMTPALAKLTKYPGGFTCLQKIMLGNIFSILTMVVAGLVERRRRDFSLSHGAPMSVWWLSPQLALLGLLEMFTFIGHTEFYNNESPDNMKSIGNSLSFLIQAFSNYVSALVVSIVNSITRSDGRTDWLNNDLNAGRLDYYYFLVAGLASLNMVYLLFCVKHYSYKVIVKAEEIP